MDRSVPVYFHSQWHVQHCNKLRSRCRSQVAKTRIRTLNDLACLITMSQSGAPHHKKCFNPVPWDWYDDYDSSHPKWKYAIDDSASDLAKDTLPASSVRRVNSWK